MNSDCITTNTIKILQEIFAILNELYEIILFEKCKRWINRQWVVRPINKERIDKGFFNTLYKELQNDASLFFKYTRMDLSTFQYLLKQVKPFLLKRKRSDVITTEERLLLTIRYLASGDEILSLALLHRIGESTASNIIQETCIAIHQALAPIYLRPPVKAAWRNISKGFENQWNMPNCIGAMDGTHFPIVAPPNSGSMFYNYKGYHSIVVLAVCNHRYEFTVVEIGAFGGESDGGILARSEFGKRMQEKTIDLPEENRKLSNTNVALPYFFVGDEAFPLKKNIMRPFPGRNLDYRRRIFNYRLSRARRCIENAFGILKARWRVLTKPINCNPNRVDNIILACICLHNFLMAQTQKSVRNLYCSQEFINEVDNARNQSEQEASNDIRNSVNSNKEAYNIRNFLADYFISKEGEVSWQKDYVMRGSYRDA